MIGLMILLFFVVYLAVLVWVTRSTASWATRNNRSPWRWGALAVFVMYNLVFWDFIPTLVTHKYYCSNEAGFWVYKTPEQWKLENPGVAETLSNIPSKQYLTSEKPDSRQYLLPDGTRLTADFNGRGELMWVNFEAKDNSSGYWLNQRFKWAIKQDAFPLSLVRRTEDVVDMQTNTSVARYVDFKTGYGGFGLGGDGSWRVFKFWLVSEHCATGEKNFFAMDNLAGIFKNLGAKND